MRTAIKEKLSFKVRRGKELYEVMAEAGANLIRYAKTLSIAEKMPNPVSGLPYECGNHLMEYLIKEMKAWVMTEDEEDITVNDALERMKPYQKREGGRRIMGAIIAMNLNQKIRRVKAWKEAVAKWQEHFKRHIKRTA